MTDEFLKQRKTAEMTELQIIIFSQSCQSWSFKSAGGGMGWDGPDRRHRGPQVPQACCLPSCTWSQQLLTWGFKHFPVGPRLPREGALGDTRQKPSGVASQVGSRQEQKEHPPSRSAVTKGKGRAHEVTPEAAPQPPRPSPSPWPARVPTLPP